APIFIHWTIWKSARRRAFGAQVERPREARIEAERLIEHLPRATLLAEGPPGARRVAPRPRVRRIQPEGRVKRRERLLRAVEAPSSTAFRNAASASASRPRADDARPAASQPRESDGWREQASSAGARASVARPTRSRRAERRTRASAPWVLDAAPAYASIASSTRSRSSRRTPWL